MRVSARLLVAGATALALGVLLLTAAGPGGAAGDKPLVWKPVIPRDAADDLVKYLGELTQKSLAKGPPAGEDAKKDWTDKLRGTGLLVAAVTASAQGGDSEPLAAARAAGLQLSEDVDKERFDAAKTTAAALASLKATAKGGEPLAADKIELLDVMNTLRLRSKGGLGFGLKPPAQASTDGIESKLLGLSKRPLPAAEMNKQADDLVRSAYILVAISEVTDGHLPKKKGATGKGAREWAGWSEDMRAAALQLAEAAKKKNSAGVKAAVNKLNSTCSECHGEFRD
jgi:cytochrome c556